MMKISSTIALLPLTFAVTAQQSMKIEEKYNILFLSCEDLDPILSCYGAKGVSTPNIDRLAKEGIRYTHAYATVAVCGASRSSIITGMYPISIGTMDHRTGPHGAYRSPQAETYKSQTSPIVRDQLGRIVPEYSAVIPEYIKCFSEYLRAEGYYCTNNPKCDYQFSCPLTAWDEVGGTADYKNRPAGMPFFSVFNHNISHESQIWVKKNDPMLVDPNSVVIPDYFPDIPVVRKDVARKYSNVQELDAQIGTFLKRLETEGLLDHTIIFFWSDHGGPLLRQKRAVGNSGMQVPLIVRFPDKRMAGTVNDQIVSLMDLGPTVMSLAGIAPPAYMHGKAFLGQYAASPKKYHFGSADRFDESRDMCRSALDGRYVYIKNFRTDLPLVYRNEYREQIEMTSTLLTMNSANQLTGDAAYIFMKTKPEEELYDLLTDPYEVHNLASKTEYSEKLLELRQALNQWISEVGDKGAIPELDLLESMWPNKIQPKTQVVQFWNDGQNMISLNCSTPGASIAYQKGSAVGGSRWQLYSKPIQSSVGEKFAARAIRIGFKTSDITNYTNPPTSVNLIDKKETLSVFPNPSTGDCSIQFYLKSASNVELSIYDAGGNLVVKDAGVFAAGNNQWRMNLESCLFKGAYLVKLKSDHGVYTNKLVIQ
jgi:arylsulfatase A-like enzyme